MAALIEMQRTNVMIMRSNANLDHGYLIYLILWYTGAKGRASCSPSIGIQFYSSSSNRDD